MRSCTKKSYGDGVFPWISFSLGHQKSDNIWNLRGLLLKRSSSVNLTLRKWSIKVDAHTFLPGNPTRFRKMVGNVTHAKARNRLPAALLNTSRAVHSLRQRPPSAQVLRGGLRVFQPPAVLICLPRASRQF